MHRITDASPVDTRTLGQDVPAKPKALKDIGMPPASKEARQTKLAQDLVEQITQKETKDADETVKTMFASGLYSNRKELVANLRSLGSAAGATLADRIDAERGYMPYRMATHLAGLLGLPGAETSESRLNSVKTVLLNYHSNDPAVQESMASSALEYLGSDRTEEAKSNLMWLLESIATGGQQAMDALKRSKSPALKKIAGALEGAGRKVDQQLHPEDYPIQNLVDSLKAHLPSL